MTLTRFGGGVEFHHSVVNVGLVYTGNLCRWVSQHLKQCLPLCSGGSGSKSYNWGGGKEMSRFSKAPILRSVVEECMYMLLPSGKRGN